MKNKKLRYDAKQLFYCQFHYQLLFKIWYDLIKINYVHNHILLHKVFKLQVFQWKNQILRKKTFGFKKKMK